MSGTLCFTIAVAHLERRVSLSWSTRLRSSLTPLFHHLEYSIHYDHLFLIIVSSVVTVFYCFLVVCDFYSLPIVMIGPHSTLLLI